MSCSTRHPESPAADALLSLLRLFSTSSSHSCLNAAGARLITGGSPPTGGALAGGKRFCRVSKPSASTLRCPLHSSSRSTRSMALDRLPSLTMAIILRVVAAAFAAAGSASWGARSSPEAEELLEPPFPPSTIGLMSAAFIWPTKSRVLSSTCKILWRIWATDGSIGLSSLSGPRMILGIINSSIQASVLPFRRTSCRTST